ncbi:urease accessory protein UreD [Kitasatospora herbaricolor]|uniref:urease accessory protein UreD n=1 Tax=Kitasatospora herbaricolor TaxID=68217 RepID=UPI001749EC24|nr:urease accessory protein UreD [Kitasatospora herbaricolor]MDQ0306979.1 urease accessory protein [Kitasatospora herbaricolor]GGV18948.1 urease accessory protein UreD [Kitasatospora herbaricolor]
MTATAPPAAGALTARARITAGPDGRGGTDLPVLAGAGPLAPRRTRGSGPAAHVVLVGSMAAPLGGDRLGVTVDVRAGAAMRVTSAAATISLPGPGPAHYDVDLTVGEGARLEWLPEQVVAAAGSHLVLHTRITLAPGAGLRYREEQVLGRHHDRARGRPPGRLTSRLTVRRAGRLLLDQQTDLGPGAPGWDGPAVLAGHRTAGQLLLVGPGSAPDPAPAPAEGSAWLALPGADASLLTAVAPDALTLRRALGG